MSAAQSLPTVPVTRGLNIDRGRDTLSDAEVRRVSVFSSSSWFVQSSFLS